MVPNYLRWICSGGFWFAISSANVSRLNVKKRENSVFQKLLRRVIGSSYSAPSSNLKIVHKVSRRAEFLFRWPTSITLEFRSSVICRYYLRCHDIVSVVTCDIAGWLTFNAWGMRGRAKDGIVYPSALAGYRIRIFHSINQPTNQPTNQSLLNVRWSD